ncbi:unnamed protein product [Clonostachys rosea f. rosea IK726]|uniref:Zn(2)-C6 fungal-type domain-containing protein n=2 Tax=Bionectria ochroleuca TaxID=29856 RepID=A0A0B7KA58_BIOOC|nr:unnamed protein product [Clonostachys rosea f. rosea IK726]
MASLRKACRNCTNAKRKCTVEVPQCARCAKRGLHCSYDLAPFNTAASKPEAHKVSYNLPGDTKSGHCVMKTFDPSFSSVPGTCKLEQSNILEMVRLGLLSVQDLIKKRKPAIFIHPGLQVQDCYNHYLTLIDGQRGGVTHPYFDHLLKVDIEAVPISEALTAVQALIIHLSISLFVSDAVEQAIAEGYIDTLSCWSQALLISAQPKLPPLLSPWQTWLFGESIRRTIIMSHILRLAYYSLKHDLCSNCLFFESLPFDKRLGLWMAESPQAWIAAAQVRLGRDVGVQLSSLHQFSQDLDGTNPELCGDMFLALVAIGHNGGDVISTYGN